MSKLGEVNILPGTLAIPVRVAGVILKELFTKAWASAAEDDGPGLEVVSTTAEGAIEADPVP